MMQIVELGCLFWLYLLDLQWMSLCTQFEDYRVKSSSLNNSIKVFFLGLKF